MDLSDLLRERLPGEEPDFSLREDGVLEQRIPTPDGDIIVEHHRHIFEVSSVGPNVLRCRYVYGDGRTCSERRVPLGSQLSSWGFSSWREENHSPGWQPGKPSYHIPPKEIGPDQCPADCPEHPGTAGKSWL